MVNSNILVPVSIAIDFGVSILYSRDEEETGAILKILAKREQTENKREINPHGKKSASTLAQQQEYLISSISNIGPKAARNLLLYFGSVQAVMRADIEELKKVKQVGPKTAARIREILESTLRYNTKTAANAKRILANAMGIVNDPTISMNEKELKEEKINILKTKKEQEKDLEKKVEKSKKKEVKRKTEKELLEFGGVGDIDE